jgi:hypothetical protein
MLETTEAKKCGATFFKMETKILFVLKQGVNVMNIVFCDFDQFLPKKAIFLKTTTQTVLIGVRMKLCRPPYCRICRPDKEQALDFYNTDPI